MRCVRWAHPGHSVRCVRWEHPGHSVRCVWWAHSGHSVLCAQHILGILRCFMFCTTWVRISARTSATAYMLLTALVMPSPRTVQQIRPPQIKQNPIRHSLITQQFDIFNSKSLMQSLYQSSVSAVGSGSVEPQQLPAYLPKFQIMCG